MSPVEEIFSQPDDWPALSRLRSTVARAPGSMVSCFDGPGFASPGSSTFTVTVCEPAFIMHSHDSKPSPAGTDGKYQLLEPVPEPMTTWPPSQAP